MTLLAAAMSRLGTESAFEVLARAKALEAAGKTIINLGIGQPDFSTPSHIVEAAIKALRDGHHGYTPAQGIPELRQAVARKLEPWAAAPLDPDRVIIVPGGKVTMFFAITMLGEAGVEIIYPDPGFPIYESLVRYSGAIPVALPLHESKGFAFDAEELLSRINERTRLIILNSPANPTGGVVPKEELDRLAEGLATWPQVMILSDEIYGEMLYEGREHRSLLGYESLRDRVILLHGASKAYAMTGWRLGYGYWPKPLVEPAVRLAVNSVSCVNAATQWAGIAALEGPQDALHDMVAAFDERRQLVVEGLNRIDGLSCVTPVGAFYAFPNIRKSGLSAKEVEKGLLEEAGVASIAGTSFGTEGEGYLRISYANSLDDIKQGLERMADWFSMKRRGS